ncbi:MAG: HAMP domain-containing histidine kinase [Cyclobacteriaceae bacterium]|nr:HAMP domain-containing histidine kinase [Cyclobacteriaceae bacterium]
MIHVFILFFSVFCYGQADQDEADSLIESLSGGNLSVMERLLALRKITSSVSDPSDRFYYASQMAQYAEEAGDLEYLQRAKLELGNSYKLKGDFTSAIIFYIDAANLADSIGHLEGTGYAYSLLAGTYDKLENYDLSNSYYGKALSIFDQIENEIMVAILNGNLGFGFYKLNALDSAEYYTTLSIRQLQKSYPTALDYAIGNLALIHLKQEKSGALAELNEILDILEQKEDWFAIADYQSQLAHIYTMQEKTELAIEAAEKGLAIASRLGLREQVRDACQSLYALYQTKANFAKALEYQTMYMIYKDSINDIRELQRISNLQTEYEVGLKQAEVDLLAAQKRNREIYLYGAMLLLFIAVTSGVFIYRSYLVKNKLSHALEKQTEKLQALNATKDKLFSIISHDLRGPVAAFRGIPFIIRGMSPDSPKEEMLGLANEIETTARRMATLLDSLLTWAMQQQGQFTVQPEPILIQTLSEEVLATYVSAARAKKINLISECDDIQIVSDRNALDTILRNLVGNALKFTKENGTITLAAIRQGNAVIIRVSDTGVGISQDKIDELFLNPAAKASFGTDGEKGLGLGLQLVKEFARLIHGTIEVQSSEGKGTTVSLVLSQG